MRADGPARGGPGAAARPELSRRWRIVAAISGLLAVFGIWPAAWGDAGPSPAEARPPVEDAVARGPAVADLPLVLLPTAGRSPVMAIIYSGDGGWRDLDKQIGENLQAMGIPVVGFDTLEYFWEKKSPDAVAAGLANIIDHFAALWGADKVLLVGYSFGADILPFAVNLLPDAERARLRQITLLAPGMKADFEIHVSGWIGASPGADAPDLVPELRRIDPGLLQCVYGAEEKAESACAALDGAEVIETSGGHHFDEDYPALTRRIVDGLVRRGAWPSH